MEHNESFEYTYSAQDQEEIRKIREKYMPREENKMEQLRKLHHSASSRAQAWSIGIGTVGALILGTGMSLVMTDLGAAFGLSQILCLILGIAVGIVGLILVALAYPVYSRILSRERQRIAPEILRLTDELLK